MSHGGTGHAESVRVYYDPQKITYQQLLDYFWRHIDPTVQDRQFCDVGAQYRTAIFYQDQAQREAAEAEPGGAAKSGRFGHIYTEVVPAGQFYVAEDYHQDYYKKNPIRYSFYRRSCGRDARVEQVWNPKALRCSSCYGRRNDASQCEIASSSDAAPRALPVPSSPRRAVGTFPPSASSPMIVR